MRAYSPGASPQVSPATDCNPSARCIYDRLVEEYGDEFTGVESTVRRVVRFAYAFLHGRVEDFLAGHVRAFEWLGGVPARVRYDNAKVTVREFLAGNRRRETNLLSSLRAHYLFDAEFCNPRKAHKKGAVESLCGYVRRNAMVPMPEVQHVAELNRHLLAWCDRDRAKHLGWETERAALRPLPTAQLKACLTRLAVVSRQALVTCDRNRYSVPASLVGQTARLDVYCDHIEVYYKDQLVASHKPLAGRGGLVTDFRHYLNVVEVKRHALLDAAFVAEMPAVCQKARGRLQRQDHGYREFAAILALNHEFPSAAVEAALVQAMDMPEEHLTAETVRQLILADLRPEPVAVAVPPDIAVKLKAPDLSLYDQLAKVVTNS
ncbi:MAG: IS21 family transposase [Firmicutes bacterium]|nr:IS21 family transposase [Bacillota bacterium]